MKKTNRIFRIIILLNFCSSALFAQQTASPKAGTRVYENLIKLSDGKALIKVYPTHNGYILTFPDKKNYLITGNHINIISENQFQRIKTSPANKTAKRTAYISVDLIDVSDKEVVIVPVPRENAIELPAGMRDGTYELYAKIEKTVGGLKDTIKTQLRINIVKEKDIITVIMEEVHVQ